MTIPLYKVRLEKYAELPYNIGMHDMPTIVNIVKDYMDSHDRENVVIVTINHNGSVNGISTAAIGSPGGCEVYLREIFKPVILNSARGFYVLHNHPTELLHFSPSDLLMAELILEVSIKLGSDFLDSLIISTTTNNYYSLREHYKEKNGSFIE